MLATGRCALRSPWDNDDPFARTRQQAATVMPAQSTGQATRRNGVAGVAAGCRICLGGGVGGSAAVHLGALGRVSPGLGLRCYGSGHPGVWRSLVSALVW